MKFPSFVKLNYHFRPGVVYTFQALSEEDCELWLDAMDGKEPMYVHPPKPGNAHHTYLDEAGFTFVTKCFQALEKRGEYQNESHFGRIYIIESCFI